MAVNNHIQLFRNQTLFESREAAITALNNANTSVENSMKVQDGNPVLARYTDTDKSVKSLLALFHVANDKTTYTLVTDGAAVEAAISALKTNVNNTFGTGVTSANTATAQFEALRGTESDTKDAVSVAGAKKYTDDAVNTLKSGATEGYDTLKGLEDNIKAVQSANTAAIEALDLATVSAEGSVITSVSQTDGKVSASGTPIVDVKLTGFANSNASGDIAATDSVKDAFSKLENRIISSTNKNSLSAGDKSIVVTSSENGNTVAVKIKNGEKVLALNNDTTEANGGIYTDIKLVEITSGLKTNVAKAYQLQGINGAPLGNAQIEIPKDSSLKDAYLGSSEDTVNSETGVVTKVAVQDAQSLNFVYHLENGTYSMAKVDVSKFLTQSEFRSGVTADENGIVHGVVDSTSEGFLTVGADGFKLHGVQDAIDTAKAEAKTVVNEKANGHVTVTVVSDATDGHAVVTVAENDIASAADLANEITHRKAVDGIDGDSYTANQNTNYISAATSLNDADIKLDAQAKANADAIATLNGDATTNGSVAKAVADAKAAINAYTVNDKAISGNPVLNGSDIELTGYEAATEASAPTSADTVNAAIAKLYKAISDATGGASSSISDEITRAQSAETSIDSVVGLTKAAGSESRTYSNPGTYIGKGQTNTIKSDIMALDTQVKKNADAIASANTKNTLSSANNALDINTQPSGTTLTINVDESTGLEIDAEKGIKISKIDGGTY
jgi:hypothetical protein